ncbi:MAG: transcription elongation factor GreB [Betaproteobacteria bacterium]|nr:MAG: transcription elongation factor GreB [Betaproteobacteria bacterium]
MSKAFTKEPDGADEDELAPEPAQPQGLKNYITPAGYARMQAELKQLLDVERPQIVSIVHWAASNGDRSENGDYIYGKKRLREIDRRIRFLIKRLEIAEVVDSGGQAQDRVFFGATVSVRDGAGQLRSVTIVGMDEVDPSRGRVSWVSPIARALLKARTGDSVTLRSPSGAEELEVEEIRYVELP